MTSQLQYREYMSELDEVQSTLLAATDALNSPLSDLVRAQIKRSQPPICAAVVLAVAQPTLPLPEDIHEEAGVRHKRILLAAALEMLHVALNVHRLLVDAALREQHSDGETTLEPAFIGSTILAGDYCFSRAAQMAAQTDRAPVVATFALALQTVSEELLREQFRRNSEQSGVQVDGDESSSSTYDETRQLLRSGALAAALLVGLSESEQQQAVALSDKFASYWTLHRYEAAGDYLPAPHWGDPLPGRWQVLLRWLNYQRANGEIPTPPPAHNN